MNRSALVLKWALMAGLVAARPAPLAAAATAAAAAQSPRATAADTSPVQDHGGTADHAGPNPLKFGPDLAIFTAIVFLVLLGVLGKFAWPVIIEALEEREKRIADNIAAAEQKHEEAKALLSQHEARLAAAAEEVRATMEEARKDAETTRGKILAEAKTAARLEHERALREIRSATDGALKELAEQSAALAVELAGKIVAQRLSVSDHDRLIREAIAKFPSNN